MMIDEGIINRFKKYTIKDKTSDCILWKGGRRGDYGVFWDGNKYIGSHRFSWIIGNGEIKEGLYVLHKCDTPACVNINHLYCGTPKDNTIDSINRGRYNYKTRARGENNGRAKLKYDDVKEIRVSKESHKKLAEKFNVSLPTINDVRRKRSWKNTKEIENVKS